MLRLPESKPKAEPIKKKSEPGWKWNQTSETGIRTRIGTKTIMVSSCALIRKGNIGVLKVKKKKKPVSPFLINAEL